MSIREAYESTPFPQRMTKAKAMTEVGLAGLAQVIAGDMEPGEMNEHLRMYASSIYAGKDIKRYVDKHAPA